MTFLELLNKISIFKNTMTMYPNFMFRGQADREWFLEPSIAQIPWRIMEN